MDSLGVMLTTEELLASYTDFGSEKEDDTFIAEVINSLASAQEDPDIIEYISLLDTRLEQDQQDPQRQNDEPLPSAKSTTFSKDGWEKHREELETLYSEKDLKLKDIMKIMRDKYGLTAGQTQYRRQFAKWGLEKNVKFNEMRKIIQIWMRRQQEGKKTQFLVRNRPVSSEKIDRFLRRTEAIVTESSPAWPTPTHIIYFTPEIVRPQKQFDTAETSSSIVPDSTDATDHTLDLFASYMRANFPSVSANTSNQPREAIEREVSQSLPRDSSLTFRGLFRTTPRSTSFYPLNDIDEEGSIFTELGQQKYWQSKDKVNRISSTNEKHLAKETLSQPPTPSYRLIPRWNQEPDFQQLIISIEANLLQPHQLNAVPNENDITTLLQRSIIKGDRETMMLALRYQNKQDFASRCPLNLLQVAQSYGRYELFVLLIMYGLTKDEDHEKAINFTRLNQAREYLQFGYPFLPNASKQNYFFIFLHQVDIATDITITSWTVDALLNGDCHMFDILSQYRYRWNWSFLIQKAPLLYNSMQTSVQSYTLIQSFLAFVKKEDSTGQIYRLQFFATALLQNEMMESILRDGTEINIKNDLGQTVLHLLSTVDYGDGTEIMTTLLRYGVAVDAVDCSGNTCLHTAVRSPWNPWKQQFVSTLIQSGANINARNHFGQTCLTSVAAHWRLDEVEELVAWLSNLGADRTLANGQGQTPDQILQLRKGI